MNIITKVVETLNDLKHDKAADMFYHMVNKFEGGTSYVEYDGPNVGVMFIFPDGRLLGDADTIVSRQDNEMVDRAGMHSDVLDFDIEDDAGDDQTSVQHPLFNYPLAKYYNLIVVASGHSADTVYVPYGVEPTPQQSARLTEFEEAGYTVESISEEEFNEELAEWEAERE